MIATAGNVLGSVVNWWLGRSVERYGRGSLLFSWVPIIGDPITVVAGILHEPFWCFLVLITLAKAARYLVLIRLTLGWLG
ncbi:hypothetical protein SAMN02787149_107218 [Pseudomonas sp. Snoq117.2]|nr:hypothetical protein SAMN02787149_107218 [Pseudomonas sp. Snoq117.2]